MLSMQEFNRFLNKIEEPEELKKLKEEKRKLKEKIGILERVPFYSYYKIKLNKRLEQINRILIDKFKCFEEYYRDKINSMLDNSLFRRYCEKTFLNFIKLFLLSILFFEKTIKLNLLVKKFKIFFIPSKFISGTILEKFIVFNRN